jgi:microcystin-dependent protein
VKYTGIDVPVLGIQTGDSLSFVEQSLITFLTSTLDGTGIYPIVDPEIICNVVKKYLPTCGDLSLNDMLSAIIKAACDLQEQVDAIVAELAVLNADYTIGCLTGVTASSDTHAIVQATINTLCTLKADFDQLLIDLPNTYVSFDEIYDIIQSYITANTNVNSISSKMVPYSVVPYFGVISNIFDSTGAGVNLVSSGGQDWRNVNLCNGLNGTPDLRGWGLVGAIVGVPGGQPLAPVNPIPGSGNPNYAINTTFGANQITLGPTQIPLHTHANTVQSIVDEHGGHQHDYITPNADGSANGNLDSHPDGPLVTRQTGVSLTGITVNTTITNVAGPAGGGLPHSNIQPVRACYYIMYVPLP